ncbi:porin [Paraburkholderia aspalathi]|uniref:porin n=1 Tax=Paraburkholderia aspalathi TaxID=1324617 RepID=UPI003CAAE739
MQKKTLVTCAGAALVLLAGNASAQSNVTLYGVLDMGFLYQNKTVSGGRVLAAQHSGWDTSLWGIRGSEDLGGGYKTEFNLQGGLAPYTGAIGNSNGGLFGRNAWVGLGGPAGTIRAGLQHSPFFIAAFESDPRGMPLYASVLIPYLNGILIDGMFDSNALIYISPKIGGLTFSAEYALGNTTSFPAGRRIAASANYNVGPLQATAAYYEGRDAGTGRRTILGQNVALGYKFSDVSLKVAFFKFKNSSDPSTATNINTYTIGGTWYLKPDLQLNAGVYFNADRNDSHSKSILYGAGAEYLLSKQTALYAQLGAVDNRGSMATTLAANGASNIAPPSGGTTLGVDFGIRHNF